jgi:hypothetical protein
LRSPATGRRKTCPYILRRRHAAKKNMEAYSEASQQVHREQAAYSQQPQQVAPAAQEDVITQLERLGALKNRGILTEEDFQAQKAKILGA